MNKAMQELQSIRRQALADGMVKLGLPMAGEDGGVEWCFARRLTASHARIDNVPAFCDGVAFGDVVEFAELSPPDELLKEFVRVVTRGSETVVLPYGDERVPRLKDGLPSLFSQVRDRLLALPQEIRPLTVEGVMPGWVALALPLGLTNEQVRAVERCIGFKPRRAQ